MRSTKRQSAPQAAGKIEALRPDVVLFDIDLPGAAQLEALRAVCAPCLVVMTARPERALPGSTSRRSIASTKPVHARAARRCPATRAAAARGAPHRRTCARDRGCRGGDPRRRHRLRRSRGRAFPDQMTIRVRRRMFSLPVERHRLDRRREPVQPRSREEAASSCCRARWPRSSASSTRRASSASIAPRS